MSARAPLHVLVVDDNEVDREMVRRSLGADYVVLEAETGAEGLRRLREQPPACVLLDQRLPDVEGASLLPDMLGVPVLMLTSSDEAGLGVEVLKSGAVDYLVKRDLSQGVLRQAVRSAIQRADLERRLVAAQHHEAVGRLAGGVAHDFNNMLQVILGRLERLEERLEESSPLHKDLGTIQLAAERSAELVGQLLAYSRQLDLRAEVVDACEVLEEFRALLQSVVGERVELEITCSCGSEAFIEIDRGQLQNAVVNLTVNARDAMPQGGLLRIALSQRECASECSDVLGTTLPAGRYVTLEVSDTGEGIPAELHQEVFDPYFTTKPVGQGTGLGLPSVHGFVRQSGGGLQLRSAPGEGTTVSLWFPRVVGVEATAAPAGAERPAPSSSSSQRILLIEDDVLVRDFLTELLSASGYEVEVAEDSAEAIQRGSAAPGAFDLILSDVILPGPLNGPEVVRELRPQQPQARLLFLSGYNQSELEEFADGLNCRMLSKPVRPKQLLSTIHALLESPPPDA